MAAQICRPSCSTTPGCSSSKVPPTSFLAQVCRNQSRVHLLPGQLHKSRDFRLRSSTKDAAFPSRLPAATAGFKQQPERDEIAEHQNDLKHLGIFKLVAKLVLPLLLLRTAPTFASTISITAVENAAKGFRVPELLASAWTGLMAGCLHTLTGPDHLAALAPLSIGRTKMEGAVVGALWGCGHDAGQIIFGLLFLVLKDKLQIDLVRTWSARIVGITLVAIGAVGIKEAQEAPVPCLAGDPGCEVEYESSNGMPGERRKKPFGFATFGTGVVHGLQPDALLVILPALALPSKLAGISFLFMFLVGTVVAMASYTAFVGSCSEALQKRVPWITQRLSLGSSLIAIVVGVSILLGEVCGINLF